MAGEIKLSKERLAELRQAQRILHDVLAEFDRMESCGVDCQYRREIHREASEQIDNLLKHYS